MKYHAVDIRGMIVAPPGHLIASVDLSQIEPRVLNYLAGNHKLLEEVRKGHAIYEAHARETMNWTGGPLKKENPKLYSLAKARVLGLGYGCGWDKFITVAQTLAGIDITEGDEDLALAESADGVIHRADEKGNPKAPFIFANRRRKLVKSLVRGAQSLVRGAQSRQIVAEFRQSNPLLTKLWADLQSSVVAQVGKDLTLELPSGRFLVYKQITETQRTVVDIETGEPYRRTEYKALIEGERVAIYGGLLTENLVQAVARDVFSYNLLRLVRAGIRVLWTIHDEAVCLVRSAEEGELARQIMAHTPPWLAGCPVDSELTLSDRFRK